MWVGLTMVGCSPSAPQPLPQPSIITITQHKNELADAALPPVQGELRIAIVTNVSENRRLIDGKDTDETVNKVAGYLRSLQNAEYKYTVLPVKSKDLVTYPKQSESFYILPSGRAFDINVEIPNLKQVAGRLHAQYVLLVVRSAESSCAEWFLFDQNGTRAPYRNKFYANRLRDVSPIPAFQWCEGKEATAALVWRRVIRDFRGLSSEAPIVSPVVSTPPPVSPPQAEKPNQQHAVVIVVGGPSATKKAAFLGTLPMGLLAQSLAKMWAQQSETVRIIPTQEWIQLRRKMPKASWQETMTALKANCVLGIDLESTVDEAANEKIGKPKKTKESKMPRKRYLVFTGYNTKLETQTAPVKYLVEKSTLASGGKKTTDAERAKNVLAKVDIEQLNSLVRTASLAK